MKYLFFIQRFYRKDFSSLLKKTFCGVFALFALLIILFAPGIKLLDEKKQGQEIIISKIEQIKEVGELRDSEPLFLPTEKNYKIENTPLVVSGNLLSLFSEDSFFEWRKTDSLYFLKKEDVPEKTIEDVFNISPKKETKWFGILQKKQNEPLTSVKLRLLIKKSNDDTILYNGYLNRLRAENKNLLLSPIEVLCYEVGEQGRYVFTIIRSTGDSFQDKQILADLESWLKSRAFKTKGYIKIKIG